METRLITKKEKAIIEGVLVRAITYRMKNEKIAWFTVGRSKKKWFLPTRDKDNG